MPYARRIVYSIALLWALFLYFHVSTTYPTVEQALINLQRYFGLTGLFMFYIVLTPGLLRVYVPSFPLNPLLIKARRAIGVSLFSFALAHSLLGFFVNLSGSVFAILLLPDQSQLALLFSFTAFCILLAMAATSFDVMVRKMGSKHWKMLHRLGYIAGILVVFHAFLIGSHFTNPRNPIPILVNVLTVTVVLLEAGATLKKTIQNRKNISELRYGVTWMAGGIIALGAVYFSFQGIMREPYDPHAEHVVARGEEYEIRLTPDKEVNPGEEVEMKIQVVDSRNGSVIEDFTIVHEKLMHLIVIKSDLTSYRHLHPEKRGNTFYQTITFPTEGVYNLYTEFQPENNVQGIAIGKQQVGLGSEEQASLAVTPLTRNFDDYQIALNPQEVGVGKTSYMTFSIRDSRTGQLITDLEPYLGAFGHLVIVSEDTKEYLHVHPSEEIRDTRRRGGPEVQFVTQFEEPGMYKVFFQFQRGGKVELAEYVIEVKS